MSNAIVPMPEPSRRGRLRRSSLRFSGRPESIKAARDWLNARMRISGTPQETADVAVLLLSELATNAIRHTDSGARGGAFQVRAFFSRERLRVEVRDSGRPLAPVSPADVPDDAEGGRGLLLVATLAHHWGRFVSDQRAGVFYELRWTAAPSLLGWERRWAATRSRVAHLREQ